MSRGSFRLLAVALGCLVGVIAAEGGRKIFLSANPAYDVLFLEPDREIGWKQVPGLRWQWAGHDLYAQEFSVGIQTNSRGFRDLERRLEKADSLVRVALLGDSFVEAVQVPFEDTAGQVLERRLNARAGGRPTLEVLNFGISNFGVGQYLLTWEQHARRFSPDYVFVFVGRMHMARTVARYEVSAFKTTRGDPLWIRPTFRLEGDALVREPAADFEAFGRAQHEVLSTQFDGSRSRQRSTGWLIPGFASRATSATLRRLGLDHEAAAANSMKVTPGTPVSDETVRLNIRILRELESQVRSQHGHLAVVDADGRLSDALQAFCVETQSGYLTLHAAIARAQQRGTVTHFESDGHFNVAGNAVFAEVMYDWLIANSAAPLSQ